MVLALFGRCPPAPAMSAVNADAHRSGPRAARWLAYLAVAGLLAWAMVRLHDPGLGFNQLVHFAAQQPEVAEIRALNVLRERAGEGYDGQYYVQLAMHPLPDRPELSEAIDNLPYRARRILLCWTAYVLGRGRPADIFAVFVTQNFVAWGLLAVLLLHWFPPNRWDNLARWAGVLLGAGMCQSVDLALVDGPSLLLICLGVWCLESNRRWLAAGVFAISGLARETNLLAAAALVRPEERGKRPLGRLALQAVLVAAPLAGWLWYLHLRIGPAVDVGMKNFGVPLVSFLVHWRQVIAEVLPPRGPGGWAVAELLATVALTTQFCFLLLRPRPAEAWWRVGVTFAVLMALLGSAVWAGHPGAAPRVLLPMQMAFNVLVPRTRRWIAVFVLGNLSLLAAPVYLAPTPGLGFGLGGAADLLVNAGGTQAARVEFDDRWYDAERGHGRYWRWSPVTAGFAIVNPQPVPVVASVSFFLDGADRRRATVTRNGVELWSGVIGHNGPRVDLPDIVLSPGDNRLIVGTDRPPVPAGRNDPRRLAFSVRDLDVRLRRRSPPR